MSQPANRALAETTCDPDVESREWLRALLASGAEREDALERLHALLLRAARFEVARRREANGDALARQVADDTLGAVMASLHTYRGDSRFTTWGSKFAVVETAARLRRRRWQGRDAAIRGRRMDQAARDDRHSPADPGRSRDRRRAAGSVSTRRARRDRTQRCPDRRARRTAGHDARRALRAPPRRPRQAARTPVGRPAFDCTSNVRRDRRRSPTRI